MKEPIVPIHSSSIWIKDRRISVLSRHITSTVFSRFRPTINVHISGRYLRNGQRFQHFYCRARKGVQRAQKVQPAPISEEMQVSDENY